MKFKIFGEHADLLYEEDIPLHEISQAVEAIESLNIVDGEGNKMDIEVEFCLTAGSDKFECWVQLSRWDEED